MHVILFQMGTFGCEEKRNITEKMGFHFSSESKIQVQAAALCVCVFFFPYLFGIFFLHPSSKQKAKSKSGWGTGKSFSRKRFTKSCHVDAKLIRNNSIMKN